MLAGSVLWSVPVNGSKVNQGLSACMIMGEAALRSTTLQGRLLLGGLAAVNC